LFIALIVDALAAEQRAVTEEHLEEIEEEMDEEFGVADKERDQILALLRELKQEIADLKATPSKSD
jgi:voltage-gated sodium channel